MTTPDDKTPNTRRLEVEVEVPGTPEQVWDAIATGPGITAWFIPTEVEEREGGTLRMDHGPGMEMTSVVSAWDRPRRFAYEDDWQPNEDVPARRIATEFLVEARSGNNCIVRVVQSGFETGADWDRAMESFESGWRQALESLRLYLTHFRGRRAAPIAANGTTTGSVDRVRAAFMDALGLGDAREGERVATSGPGVPRLAGTVERADDGMLTLVLDEPAPGLGFVGAGGPAGEVFTIVRAQLFGDDAAAVAGREQEAWRAWMDEHITSG
jgi:uncharacterized protein YndB with AHSA1/START domain